MGRDQQLEPEGEAQHVTRQGDSAMPSFLVFGNIWQQMQLCSWWHMYEVAAGGKVLIQTSML